MRYYRIIEEGKPVKIIISPYTEKGEEVTEQIPEELKGNTKAIAEYIMSLPLPEDPEPTYTLDEAAAILTEEVANEL